MSNGWSPERRAHQAAMIRSWQPWKHATGPKSEEGKKRASRNAYKGGEWTQARQAIKQLKQLMREQRSMVEQVFS